MAIVDAAGNPVVEYKYDAWGNHISAVPETGVGVINPFRYRGYIYDEGSKIYYLRCRYFHSDTARFINADTILSSRGLLGMNTYCYCMNNSILMIDPSGKKAFPNSGTLARYLIERLILKVLPSDWLGTKLLTHWMDGEGEKMTIKDDQKTNDYLWNSNKVQAKVRTYVANAIIYNIPIDVDDLNTGICDESDIGGYSSGYNIINLCKIRISGSWKKMSDGSYQINVNYKLTDAINANEDNPSDMLYLGVAKAFLINGNSGMSYDLEISGTWEFNMSASEVWGIW